ncbi:MAG: hypothetical protein JWO96_423 [Candidatus Saccharibacteria bacterium]|nr:hypothetical protein [Candidatus Saccharibacteria bacterium]
MRGFLVQAEKTKPYEETRDQYLAERVGGIALFGFSKEDIGVNDPLAHLDQYLSGGEATLSYIEEDVITDCAERFIKPKFINSVNFRFTGNDFLSKEGNFSMNIMTAITEKKFGSQKIVDIDEYKRAKIEAQEPKRLAGWFPGARPGDAFIAESLDLADNERYTIVRIYEKVNDEELTEHVVTLHNASVSLFNDLHKEMGVYGADLNTPLEVLDHMYAYSPEQGDFRGFIEYYINAYDQMLAQRNPAREYIFGLDAKERKNLKDDMEIVREQKQLRSIYTEALARLGESGGYVTPDIINFNSKLQIGLPLEAAQKLTADSARGLLDGALQYIAATLNQASEENLRALARAPGMDSVYSAAGNYGMAAKEAGIRYQGVCPEAMGKAAQGELAMLQKVYNRDPTKCQQCPGCKKTVDLPEELFHKDKILHCTACKLNFDKKSGKSYYKDMLAEKSKVTEKPGIISLDLARKESEIKHKEQERKSKELQKIA